MSVLQLRPSGLLPRSLSVLALLLLVLCVLLPLQATAEDGCYECCHGGTCRYAFDGEPGQCCGQQRNTVYCCPAGLVCAQTYEDAICVSRTSDEVITYAYSYNNAGAGMASWLISIIVILSVCCCVAMCALAYRRRKMMMAGPPDGPPVAMGDGPYERRYSMESGPSAPFASSYPQPAPYAQPAAVPYSGAPVGVAASGPASGYQQEGAFVGEPHRYAPAPPPYRA